MIEIKPEWISTISHKGGIQLYLDISGMAGEVEIYMTFPKGLQRSIQDYVAKEKRYKDVWLDPDHILIIKGKIYYTEEN